MNWQTTETVLTYTGVLAFGAAFWWMLGGAIFRAFF
jgi:hypothetical protein